MRILFIGDVMGAAGLAALSSLLPPLLSRWQVDITIVNGENSADLGFGITFDSYRAIREAGADVVTLGNHSWHRKEAFELIQKESHLVRPINYVPDTPGAELVEVQTAKQKRVLVMNALGRLFMEPADDPFGAVSRVLEQRRLARDVDATRPVKSKQWDISATDGLVSSSARIPIRQAQIAAFCPAVPLTLQTRE